MKRQSYFYRFADGYWCWYACRLKGADRTFEMKQHGAIIEERPC